MQISAGLLAATQSLLTSPSPPPFLASFKIWSVSPLPSQPSSSVPWILFFLPAFVSVAGTLRIVLVTLSPGGQEHHSKSMNLPSSCFSLKPFLPHTLLFIYLTKTVVQLLNQPGEHLGLLWRNCSVSLDTGCHIIPAVSMPRRKGVTALSCSVHSIICCP